MDCTLYSEVEDERGVMKKVMAPADRVMEKIYDFFTQNFRCESIYINKWQAMTNSYYRYEGTVYLKEDKTIIFQVNNSGRIHFLVDPKNSKKFIEGTELKTYRDSDTISL